jgi:hypothetical protein
MPRNDWLRKFPPAALKPGDVVVCETVAAIVPHARIVDERGIRLGGWHNGPTALCGAVLGWDTYLPVGAVRCRSCLEALATRRST